MRGFIITAFSSFSRLCVCLVLYLFVVDVVEECNVCRYSIFDESVAASSVSTITLVWHDTEDIISVCFKGCVARLVINDVWVRVPHHVICNLHSVRLCLYFRIRSHVMLIAA